MYLLQRVLVHVSLTVGQYLRGTVIDYISKTFKCIILFPLFISPKAIFLSVIPNLLNVRLCKQESLGLNSRRARKVATNFLIMQDKNLRDILSSRRICKHNLLMLIILSPVTSKVIRTGSITNPRVVIV